MAKSFGDNKTRIFRFFRLNRLRRWSQNLGLIETILQKLLKIFLNKKFYAMKKYSTYLKFLTIIDKS